MSASSPLIEETLKQDGVQKRCKSGSVLPSQELIADKVREWAKDASEADRFPNEDLGGFGKETLILRRMCEEYINAMQGVSSLRDRIETFFFATTHKDELINALSATKTVWSTLTSNPDLWKAFNSRCLVFSTVVMKDEDVKLNPVDWYVLELLNFLALMVLIMLPLDSYLWRYRKGEPWKLPGEKFFDDFVSEGKCTLFGIDRYWLSDDLETKLSMSKAMYRMMKSADFRNPDCPKKIRKHEDRIVGLFIQFLSSVEATLEKQLAQCVTTHNKILSMLSTLAFTLISYFFKKFNEV